MKRSLRTIIAGILLAAASYVPAQAQNVNWAGFYLGAGLGGGWGSAVPSTPGSPTLKSSGFMGEVLAGYNLQYDDVVFGPELSVAIGDVKGEVKDGNYLTYDGRAEMLATFAGRLGYSLGRFMPYVKGGAALAEMKASLGCPPAAGFGDCHYLGAFSSSVDATKWGWAIGGGLEYAIDQARNWSAFAEYMHYDFGAVSVTYQTPLGPAPGQSDVTFNVAKAGFKYHF